MSDLNKWIARTKRRNKHLYENGMTEGIDYVVCPETKVRSSFFRKDHVEKRLGLSMKEFHERFPDAKLQCSSRSDNIKSALSEIDNETGLTKHALSIQKSVETRRAVGDDGLTINQKIGHKTRQAHLSTLDEDGLNGYQRLARYRNETILDNGLSIQQQALLKNWERRTGKRHRGASRISKIALRPIIEFLNAHSIKYYFDETEYGLRTETKYYLYDLVIPALELNVEFNGRNFHPDPSLSEQDWSSWRQTFTGKTANQVVCEDYQKWKALFDHRGFRTWEIFEKDHPTQISILLDYIRSAIEDTCFVVARNDEYEILGPDGWVDFNGIVKKPAQPITRISLSDGSMIEATDQHQFFMLGRPIACRDLQIGFVLDGNQSHIVDLETMMDSVVYDILEVKNPDHKFLLSNGVVTKNCDEMAFCHANMLEDMFTSLSPTLATGGRCIITSTPKSDVDMFAKIWFGALDNKDEYGNIIPHSNGEGRNGYFPFQAIWSDHPDRDDAWAAKEKATVGEQKFLQEHCASFVSDDETLIDAMILSTVKVMEKPDYFTGTVRWYKDPEPNKTYFVGLDPSTGTGVGDNAAIQVFSVPEMEQIAEWQSNKIAPRGQVKTLLQILHCLDGELRDNPEQRGDPEIFFTIKNNGMGEAILVIIEDTGEEKFPGVFVSERKKKGQAKKRFRKGLDTNNRRKLAACMRLKSLIETRRMTINSQNLKDELKTFVASGASYEAKPGMKDDLVSATLLVVRMLEIVIKQGNLSSQELKEQIDPDEIFGREDDFDDPEGAPMPTMFDGL